MPESARTQRENPDEPPWGWVEELLAQVIEEVSVLAADRRRKEPKKVKRPFLTSDESSGGLAENASGGLTAQGHDAMLAMFRAKVGRALPAPAAPAPDEQSTDATGTSEEVTGG